ncbi:glycosidase [Acholeplasma morum]|uniref:glycoside hydrolase family 13 protein n=1 Tax=Paracholeplasma morum TaxID=264637 RepID=UPI00195EFFDF|nr:glycoside hydrolase family 13 protein [Paracholeplasma morum]MBM7453712.1 glycosidase [Paracholeplasma morum]
MNKHALLHKSKSEMAYAYDKNTLHIWLRTQANDFKSVKLLYGDPFRYEPVDDDHIHWVWVQENANDEEMVKRFTDKEYDYYFLSIKPEHLRVKYAFLLDERYLYGVREIYDLKDGDATKKFNLFNYFNYPFLNEADIISIPSWVKDTVWYEIFPERFRRGKNSVNPVTNAWGVPSENVTNHMFFGGDIPGIIESLDYIKDLGITGIYFTPLFESPSAHKYDTTNYFKIDPAFGTNEDFKVLVQESHKRGIKVVLDAVFNHCGYDHPFFQDVVKHGKASKYYNSFFVKDEPMLNFKLNEHGKPIYSRGLIPNYHTFAFTPYMPKWNTEDPLARQHLLEVAEYWIKEYDIDGWRLDVSNEVSHDFWKAFRQTVKKAKKDAFIFGENWDYSMPWLGGDQIDTVMNYELVYLIWQFFGHDPNIPTIEASELVRLSNKLLASYPQQITENMFNLVDSHDTARILDRSLENRDLAFLTYLFMFSFPGTPTIYYGGEIGITGKHDPDNRRCMIWDESKQDLAFKDRIKTLISWRKTHEAFKSSDLRWIHHDDSKRVIVYEKLAGETFVFLINSSNQDQTISIKGLEGINLETNESIKDTFTLSPYGYIILKK